MIREHAPWLVLVMLAAIASEAAWRLRRGRGYAWRPALGSLGVAAGNLALRGVNAAVIGAGLAAAWRYAPARWPLEDWRTWAAGFVLAELAYYLFHRLSHEVRWMWASHAVHHSSEQMTLLSALRLGWTNAVSGAWLVYAPLVLAGFDPRLITGLLAINLNYQFFLHTEAIGRLGPLEWVLNTPAHHRVHHASNGPYLDRNYGGMLIVFDRLFGTFAAERPDTALRYGLTRPVATANPVRLAFGEWARLFHDVVRARGWRARLVQAFGRPS